MYALHANKKLVIRIAPIGALLCILPCSTGCDPVRRTEQTVVLHLSPLVAQQHGDTDEVLISIKEHHQPSEEEKKFDEFNPKRNEQMFPWTDPVKTDDSGRASITRGVTRLDRSKGDTPPPSHYPLEDRTFRVKIQEQNGEVAELLVKMSKGVAVQGDRYLVSVESLSNAIYVNPD